MNIDPREIDEFLIVIVLELIKEDIVFLKKFKQFAEVISEKIESFSKNPNCSCRTTIVNYIDQNKESVKNFLLYFLSENPQINLNIDEIIRKNKSIDVRGRIFRIAKNDESFHQFYQHIINNNFQFSQFSVSQDGDFWVIFFL